MSVLTALKELDAERYVAALFVPPEKREAFAALAAYFGELERITRIASDPMPGEIRLQWWRDVIAGERDGEAASHPVAAALLDAMRNPAIPAQAFARVLDSMAEARIFDLYHDAMPDMAALEGYLGETHAALIQCQALVLDADAAAGAADLSGHAGMATGIAALLLALPRHVARGQCFIPADMLAAAGTSAASLAEADDAARMRLVSIIAGVGRTHLAEFHQRAATMPATLRPAYVTTANCADVFAKAEKTGAAIFTQTPALSRLPALARISRRALFGW